MGRLVQPLRERASPFAGRAGDGESYWLEGVMLLTVYAVLGTLFFHLPS